MRVTKTVNVRCYPLLAGGEFPYIASTEGQVGQHSVTFDVTGSDGASASFTVQYTVPGEFYSFLLSRKSFVWAYTNSLDMSRYHVGVHVLAVCCIRSYVLQQLGITIHATCSFMA